MATTEETAIAKAQGGGISLLKRLAGKYNVEESKFLNTIIQTVFTAGKAPSSGNATPGRGLAPTHEMVMTFLIVAEKYDLDPFLKQIYPFIDSQGNLRVIVGIDGWITVALRHPMYDGHEFRDHLDHSTNALIAVTCKMHRKDRSQPIEMTEYMSECKRDTEPWNKWPSRMLHHKAFIQTARYALGMGEIIDDDELDRIESVRGASHEVVQEPQRRSTQIASSPAASLPAPAAAPDQAPAKTFSGESMTTQLDREEKLVDEKRTEPDEPISSAQAKELQRVGFGRSLSLMDQNAMLKKEFGVSKMHELRVSQFQNALYLLEKAPKP